MGGCCVSLPVVPLPIAPEIEKVEPAAFEYEFVKQLGKGAFGIVDQVRRKRDNVIFARKRILCRGEKERNAALMEGQIMMSMNHPKIVKCEQVFVDEGDVVIIMECLQYDVRDQISLLHRNNRQLTIKCLQRYLFDLLCALHYLHSKQYVYRDLKLANLFVTRDFRLKLGDFGLVAKCANGCKQLSEVAGTPFFMAPELLNDEFYDESVDIWSCGCCAVVMSVSKDDLRRRGLLKILAMMTSCTLNKIFELMREAKFTEEFIAVVQRMLQYDSKDRPCAFELMQDPFFKDQFQDWKQNQDAVTPLSFCISEMTTEMPFQPSLSVSDQQHIVPSLFKHPRIFCFVVDTFGLIRKASVFMEQHFQIQNRFVMLQELYPTSFKQELETYRLPFEASLPFDQLCVRLLMCNRKRPDVWIFCNHLEQTFECRNFYCIDTLFEKEPCCFFISEHMNQ